MNVTDAIARLLDNPQAVPDGELLDALRQDYPYLTLPAALALKRGATAMSAEERGSLMAQVSLNAAGRDTLFRLLDPDGKALEEFRKQMNGVKNSSQANTTEKAIDLFLATYGRMEPREEALLEKMIFNPVPDYASILEREETEDETIKNETSEQDKMLDAFLQEEKAGIKQLEPQPQHTDTAPQEKPAEKPTQRPSRKADGAGSLSESLAQIYIRQRRFDKAYDIIHHLSLNNPEKSVYFADQLRFLQKLMLNNRYKR